MRTGIATGSHRRVRTQPAALPRHPARNRRIRFIGGDAGLRFVDPRTWLLLLHFGDGVAGGRAFPGGVRISRTRRLIRCSRDSAAGQTIGIDATTLEANAALRSIVRRDTGDTYQAFLTKLAQASGIETPTRADLARLDRTRRKKGSNDDWTHPHDPDAKITKMKDGRTHPGPQGRARGGSDTGAIVGVTVQPANAGVRTRDIRRGIDRRTTPVEAIGDRFPGVRFGVAAGVTDISSGKKLVGDPVRMGRSDIVSFGPAGTATSGTVYVRSRSGRQYAVRVLGATGRVRVLGFNVEMGKWLPE